MNALKKTGVLLLILACIFVGSACSVQNDVPQVESKPAICGIWQMKINLTDEVNSRFSQIIGDDLVLPETDIQLIYTMDIREGEEIIMSMTLDEDSLDEYYEDLCDVVVDFAISYVAEDGMSQQELEDKCQTEYGMSLREYVLSSLMDNTPVSSEWIPSVSENGFYRIDGNKLWIAEGKESLSNTQSYMIFNLQGDTLTIDSVGSNGEELSGESADLFGHKLPWKFDRVG